MDELDGVADALSSVGRLATQTAREASESGEDHDPGLLCGCHRAPQEAFALFELAKRTLEGLILLGRKHPGFASPAMNLARPIIDYAARISWLMTPADAKERDLRVTAFLAEYHRLFDDTSIDSTHLAEDPDRLAHGLGYEQADKRLNTKLMMDERPDIFDHEVDMYQLFRYASQTVHGGLHGSGAFKLEHRWAVNETEDLQDAEFWSMPVFSAFEGASAAIRVFAPIAAPTYEYAYSERRKQIQAHLRLVPANRLHISDQERKREEFRVWMNSQTQPKPNRQQRRAIESKRRKSM